MTRVAADRSLRIAFLTPEFITDYPNLGGLGQYVERMARAVVNCGHEAEIFTVGRGDAAVSMHDGIRVETVARTHNRAIGLLTRFLPPKTRGYTIASLRRLAGAGELAKALERRQGEQPFDIVQSSDYGFAGLFVRHASGRRHIVRCSWAPDLYLELDGRHGLNEHVTAWLERRCIRKADRAYAPSESLGRYFRERHGLAVSVVRPPIQEIATPAAPTVPVPDRYLVHFGRLSPRKGSRALAEALPDVWKEAPDFRMVWVGGELWPGEVERYRALWNRGEDRVTWIDAVPRGQLHAIVARAEASVLPSLADNLPNTAIESLLVGTPVIAFDGASLDEIVDDGCGELVAMGDRRALSEALLRAWRRERSPIRRPALFAEMEPRRAVENLLAFALGDETL